MKRGLFVTGTDTGVGKTLVSALLVSALVRSGRRAGYFKPVQTGSESDRDEVRRLVPHDDVLFPEPAASFALPAAPFRAATAEGRSVDLAAIVRAWDALPDAAWVVEGAGGLLVPLTATETTRDFVRALGLPVLVVASTRLGTINATLLTLEALGRAGIPILGVVLNGEPDPGLREVIESFGATTVVAEIPKLPAITPEGVAGQAGIDFGDGRIEALFGGCA